MEQPTLQRADAEVLLTGSFSLNSKLTPLESHDSDQGVWSRGLTQSKRAKDTWWQQAVEERSSRTVASESDLLWEVDDLKQRRGSINNWWNSDKSTLHTQGIESWQVSSIGSAGSSESGLTDDGSGEDASATDSPAVVKNASSRRPRHQDCKHKQKDRRRHTELKPLDGDLPTCLAEGEAQLADREADPEEEPSASSRSLSTTDTSSPQERMPKESEQKPLDVLRSNLLHSDVAEAEAQRADDEEDAEERTQGLFEEFVDVLFDKVFSLYCCQSGAGRLS